MVFWFVIIFCRNVIVYCFGQKNVLCDSFFCLIQVHKVEKFNNAVHNRFRVSLKKNKN